MDISFPCLFYNCLSDSNSMAIWMYLFMTIYSVNSQSTTPPTAVSAPEFTNYRQLDYEGKYILGWKHNATDIEFEVTVQTPGYVGLGFSKTGEMRPSDMVIGWITDGQMYLGDYHVNETDRIPLMDDKPESDWVVLGGIEVNGTTVLRFSRKLDTCDPQDQVITGDRMSVIWAYHDIEPDVNTGLMQKHDMNNRGVVNMNLLNDDVMLTSFPSDTYMIDATIGEFTIPAVGSTLQCRVFANGAIPAGNLIKFEPSITPGNEPHVYRMSLYQSGNVTSNLENTLHNCDDLSSLVRSRLVATWSMGGQAFHMPEGVGLPMAGLGYVLEIHYSKWQEMTDENGSPVTIPDGSGLRLTYTTSPVTHLAGMLELGRAISSGWSQLIPDKETAFTSTAYCSPKCMTWGFNNDNEPMNVFGVLLKGNDVARSLKVRHFRNETELPWIDSDGAFSNFFQAPRRLNVPVQVKFNDTLAVECTYDTSDRVGPTRGGFSRVQELCRATLIYYPVKQFDMCLSWSSFDKLQNEKGNIVPEKDAMGYLQNATAWDADLRRRFKAALTMSDERSVCSSISRQPAYAIDRFEIPVIKTPHAPTEKCQKFKLNSFN
ncbi:DBH-like monooxygenase protein 1 homolog [Mya arenaria]|uniref:DBH-like monooxygenase protein 1 homolog n=1 Tax=Mya arenaria TaxID=6604 RepID=UPI0022E6CB30|nr:DBH-like monooxygenase protein 1 homolog [Mya arenaria]